MEESALAGVRGALVVRVGVVEPGQVPAAVLGEGVMPSPPEATRSQSCSGVVTPPG
ncbi:hypothetical protein ACFQVA_40990 [Actinomadura keratinilytica]